MFLQTDLGNLFESKEHFSGRVFFCTFYLHALLTAHVASPVRTAIESSCLSTRSCEWLLFIERGSPLISQGSLGSHYHGESCPSLLAHFNIDWEKRYTGWGDLVSSDGTPAPVNMHAGIWAVEELGVAGTCDMGDGRSVSGIIWGPSHNNKRGCKFHWT